MQLAGLCAVIRTISFVIAQFFAGMAILGIADKARFMRRISIYTRSLALLMIPALLSGIPKPMSAVCSSFFSFCFTEGTAISALRG
jgi:hypothetical protein